MQLLGWLLYFFTLVTTLVILAGLPIALVWLAVRHLRTRRHARHILMAGLIAAGFLIGGMAGWSLRPFSWQMPFWETARASIDSETYGHPLESQAERVLLYVLFTSDLGALAVGIAATALAFRLRRCAPG